MVGKMMSLEIELKTVQITSYDQRNFEQTNNKNSVIRINGSFAHIILVNFQLAHTVTWAATLDEEYSNTNIEDFHEN